MTTVRLTGQLRCATDADIERVRAHLPEHVRVTREEPGCLSFEVVQTADPLIWQVDEEFTDAVAFRAHQERAAASTWARETVGIERAYTVEGMGA